jgi:hypothetical protein
MRSSKTSFMKSLLIVAAFTELIAGLVLVTSPLTLVSILTGIDIIDSAAVLTGRVAGFALLSLSVACWLSRNEMKSALTLTRSMLVYNIGVTVILLNSALKTDVPGIVLWPAVALHVVLAGWSLIYILRFKMSLA